MTSEDIRNVTFEQIRRGYSPEDVDDFLMQVAGEMDLLATERNDAIAAKTDAENKMYILAEKVEEYRGQEETLKTALINAQRMGEQVVHEAKQKAEQMVREATGQSELLRQQAEAEINRERTTLENLISEVNRFRANILNLYKQHIESLSAVDPHVERAEDVLQTGGRAKFATPEGETEPPAPIVEEPVLIGGAPEADAADTTSTQAEVAVATELIDTPLSPVPEQGAAQPGPGSLFEGVPIEED